VLILFENYISLITIFSNLRRQNETMNLVDASIKIILKNQSKYGSYIASPNFKQYMYCWIRDGVFIAYAMDLTGHHKSSRLFHKWVIMVIEKYSWKVKRLLKKLRRREKREENEYLHARYTLEGHEASTPWPNKQFDGYGAWLWGLTEHIKITGEEYLIDKHSDQIKVIIEYLANFWNEPSYDCWEENPGKIHTSTLACVAGGLSHINNYLKSNEVSELVNKIISFIKNKCVIGGRFAKFYDPHINEAKGIDASLLWLTYPFKVFKPEDPLFRNTIALIEKKLLEPDGGVHRHLEDTYYGGGEWIILSAWLAWHYVEIGRKEKAWRLIEWIESTADDQGNLPEQVPHHLLAPKHYEHWVKKWGPIAKPLLWSHAMYIILKEKI